MAENKKNQDQTSKQENQTLDRDRQKETSSSRNVQDQNPQDGSRWNNYQTREMSDEGTGSGTKPKSE